MVEFKIKTLAEQACTIDAANADLYDGSSEFLKAGGSLEPKKALLRFKIAEKPNFGNAKLSHAEMGIYTTGVTKGQSAKIPQFNIYKMKSSTNGQDWGASGRIKTVTRGKRIVDLNATTNIFTVYNHGLFTGDVVTYTPMVNFYGDVELTTILPEKEYYIVRDTRDKFKLAASLQDAYENTTINVAITTGPVTETVGGTVAGFPLADGENYGVSHYGWIRSEKYSSDIHVVTAYHDDAETLSENFDGSPYRETDLGFEAVNRTVIRRGEPYLAFGNLEAELWDTKSDSHSQNGDESDLRDWYGYKVSDGNAKDMVKLKSHKTNADGSGWWRTKKTTKSNGKDDYVPKKIGKKMNPAVLYDDEIITGNTPYGDEVTPENSFFHRVKGAAEFQEAADDDSGNNVLQATGAVRFSTEHKKTGGQALNFYQFWKKDAIGVNYNSSSGNYSGRQECMVLRKDIPWAPYQGPHIDVTYFRKTVPDQMPHATDVLPSSHNNTPCMTLTMNMIKLEKAYSVGVDSDTDRIYQSRGITVIFSESAPIKGESLYEYMLRLHNTSAPSDDALFGTATGQNCLGFTLANTNIGVRILSLAHAKFDTGLNDMYWERDNDLNDADSAVSGSHPSGGPGTDNRTGISEGEWYDYKIFSNSTNTYAQLNVEDSEGQQCQFYNENTFEDIAYALFNCKSTAGSLSTSSTGDPLGSRQSGDGTGATSTSGNLGWWGKHMSIWVSNRQSGYSTSSSSKGTDWMGSIDEEDNPADRDTENNIFIDAISYTGINHSYDNATLGQVGAKGRDRITISGGKKFNKMPAGDMDLDNTKGSSKQNREGQSDTAILLGFEDPSQISSHAQKRKSWRYLYFQDYLSSNLSSDAPLIWTADGTLPHNKGSSTSTYLQAGQAGTQQWFTKTYGYTESTDTKYRYWSDYNQDYLDYGLPYTYNNFLNTYFSYSYDFFAPSIVTAYTNASDSLGMQWGRAPTEQRELFFNRTGGWTNKDTTETYPNSGTQGGIGANLRMYQTAPSLGACVDLTLGDVDATEALTVNSRGGPDGGIAHNWVTGQKVVYVNLSSGDDITGLTPAEGDFTDTPTDGAGTYYVIRVDGDNLDPTVDGLTAPTHSSGTCQSGSTSTTIKLASGASSSNDTYNYHRITITGGTGVGGESRVIQDYVGSTRVATVAPWTTTPDNTTTYKIWELPAHFTDRSTSFKLATSYTRAVAGDAENLTVGSASGKHMFYDYEYYMNRYYYTNGFSQKGFNRLILHPTLNATVAYINAEHRNTDGTEDLADKQGTETKLYLCKREHMSCAAKILELADGSVARNSGAASGGAVANTPDNIQLRVDTSTPLRSVPGTKYRIFIPSIALSTANYASNLSINIIDEENIVVEGWNGVADDGSSKLFQDGNISELWISPEKYWVYHWIRPETGDTKEGTKRTPNKSYGNVVICSPSGSGTGALTGAAVSDATDAVFADADYDAWGTPGCTYNESNANFDRVGGINGAYINSWKPELNMDKNKTIFDLSDFGYGGATEDKDNTGGENGVLNGQVSQFIPRTNQVNFINMPKVLTGEEKKEEGDTLDLAISAGSMKTDGIVGIASDNNAYLPKPFLLSVFEDDIPANPTEFKVKPFENDAFLPEFTWSTSDGDLWYGFMIIDDKQISNQYQNSILHLPLNEDLRSVATQYDATNNRGWKYLSGADPSSGIYAYRYFNVSGPTSGRWAGSSSLATAKGTEKFTIKAAKLYDNVEGLAGNTKYFYNDGDGDDGDDDFISVGVFDPDTIGNSYLNYPTEEMSVLVHVTPDAYATDANNPLYIAGFSTASDTANTNDPAAWGIYLDNNGQVNAFITAGAGDSAIAGNIHVELKSTTKLPTDGTPTCIILTVDTTLHSGNAKLFLDGKLEDQTGLRKAAASLTAGTDVNNWPSNDTGLGGQVIWYDSDTDYYLTLGAKSSNNVNIGYHGFHGKIEEFVWYDKCIYPLIPQDGKMVLEKPIEELASGSTSASSKSYNARLFIKDYHNIRGKTTGEVAASSQVSFKKAAFGLYT